jgi:hypothetical protein
MRTYFYKDVEAQGKGQSPLLNRPTMSQTAGDGRFSGTKKGWAFDAAKKSAGGDPALALFLIASCGHDDIMQDSDQAIPLEGEEMRSYCKEMQAIAQKTGDRGNGAIYRVCAEKPDFQVTFNCPERDSQFYLAQSLAGNADISKSLKEKIIKVQAPVKGGDYIPAKYYHVYAAAYAACDMRKHGASEKSAREIAKLGAFGYRYVRFRNDSVNQLAVYEANHDTYLNAIKAGETTEPEYEWLLKYFTRKSDEDTTKESEKESEAEKALKDKNVKLSKAEIESLKKQVKDEKIQKKQAELTKKKGQTKPELTVAAMDASFLMNKTVFKDGKVFGIDPSGKGGTWENFKAATRLFDHVGDRAAEVMKSGDIERIAAEEKWSPERLKRAKEKLETYFVDWEWIPWRSTPSAPNSEPKSVKKIRATTSRPHAKRPVIRATRRRA